MTYIFTLLLWIPITLGSTHNIQNHSIQSELGLITFNADSEWSLKHNIFGMKNWLFSPKLNNSKSSLTVTDTKAKIELQIEVIEKNHKKYEVLKSNWANKTNAKVISFRPMQTFKNSHGHPVSKIGFSYIHKETTYVENSYYISCRGNILFAKSLRSEKNKVHETNFQKVIQSMDCSL